MEQYDVVLLKTASNTEIKSVIYADEGETSDAIVLKIRVNGTTISSASEQYLDAYQQIKDELLKFGYGLKCRGSLINANQSAMMAYTPKIYLVQKGKQASLKDIVSLWNYCDISCFPTAAEQNEFSQNWQHSLRHREP